MNVGPTVNWLAVVLIVTGCTSATKAGSGIPIEDPSVYALPLSSGVKTKLVLAGTNYPVVMKTTQVKDLVRVELLAHGETFEIESYMSTKNSFALKEAAEEKYAPALDLLRFPMRVGDTWTWDGTMTTGGIAKKATAKITSVSEKIYFGGASHDTVRVNVMLLLDANPSKSPLERKMAFWFEAKSGIIRREFGPASRREPQEL